MSASVSKGKCNATILTCIGHTTYLFNKARSKLEAQVGRVINCFTVHFLSMYVYVAWGMYYVRMSQHVCLHAGLSMVILITRTHVQGVK